MSKKIALGGERLGSGKKMDVELHGYQRSTHNMGYVWRSTMAAGTLVPFLSEVALPGDTFDIDLDCDIKTHPTVGPLFGSFKAELHIFRAPMRLYNRKLHNNAVNVGMHMNTIYFPTLTLENKGMSSVDYIKLADLDNSQINPSSIAAYLGIRGIGIGSQGNDVIRSFNGMPWLAYWEIVKQYFANKQEERGWVIHTTPPEGSIWGVTAVTVAGTAINGTAVVQMTAPTQIVVNWSGAEPNMDTVMIIMENGEQIAVTQLGQLAVTNAQSKTFIYRWFVYGNRGAKGYIQNGGTQPVPKKIGLSPYNLENIDKMREILLGASMVQPFDILEAAEANGLTPYTYLNDKDSTGRFKSIMESQEGLAVKTYQSDLLNNWLNTEWIDGTGGINDITKIDVSDGYLELDTLNLAKKVYNILTRVAVSGGSYQDWLGAVWDHDRHTETESPIYHGGLMKEIVFEEVVSNSDAAGAAGNQPLGTLAGRGKMSKKHKGGKVSIKVDEPSYIIGIISITPRLDYSQGNRWDVNLKTLDELHKPGLDQIGFQELITEKAAWWSSNQPTTGAPWEKKSAGKQPAWIDYMTNINRVLGNFAINTPNNEGFMVLSRRYEPEWGGSSEGFHIKDMTTYIDPTKFNHIFAETALDAQNFWAQIGVDMIVRRKMSAKVIPNI